MGTGARGYRQGQAHERATARRHQASAQPRKANSMIVAWIHECLEQQWSPKKVSGQISGRMLQERGMSLSHHIWVSECDGCNLFRLINATINIFLCSGFDKTRACLYADPSPDPKSAYHFSGRWT